MMDGARPRCLASFGFGFQGSEFMVQGLGFQI